MGSGEVGLVEWWERHQIALYLGAMAVGAAVGLLAGHTATGWERAINPVLAALLYATFLQVPAAELLRSLRSGRFLGAVLVINFVVVPLVVAAMFTLLPADQAVRLGVLLVLLAPCVDYVIVFSGLAGADSRKLLAVTPLLLIGQMLLLPVLLGLFLGPDLLELVEPEPFVEAFVLLIVIPLVAAWLTQAWAARARTGRVVAKGVGMAMVPLTAATLLTVAAAALPQAGGDLPRALTVVPFYVVFLVVMPLAGLLVTRLFRLGGRDGRAILFSGATRNSLVVLPLALALPEDAAIVAVVIVTQTLVEVIGMVVYLRLVPRVLPIREPQG
ncbi:bile acid:sodium symporter [Actinoalloteichus hymeniacidonis]|uniref:Arsenite efflux pump ACR3-like permease n=1 Tax=Actinoalloteichus hymeniacidonis TaxID=340345 RepID=A0AAC9MZ15_9PSEU|nr:bile acid:sodium symporter [Actinoalloteichus hymeniacidonis]AOS63451.1 arsenite efflux pump ACR3-like permease [Actinoalloteichus hymeniacidonis]MBB5908507.1 ACR3 family arsenite efflux pump ArsB [Actinoalloteichus hymeniacidonis]